MTFVSYAQNFEDILLWRALKHVPNGFYIDVGASHPDIDTVTRAFYDRGWRGINIEPTVAMHRRLVAARPRDMNLRMAMGREAGTATFYAVGDSNTGLSTLDRGAVERYAAQGMAVEETVIPTDTLAAVCREHVVGDVHFLKIDVEGAERLVLEGADFTAFRPWIVLAEATAPMSTVETHAEWEPILLGAGYRFVWFDGLNRFYVAGERHEALAPHFRTPPNVFDDFLRAADTEWARRVDQAESRLDAVMQRALAAEQRAALAEDRAELAHLRLAYTSVEAARTAELAENHTAVVAEMENQAAHAAAEMRHAVAVAEDAMHRADSATAWLGAMQNSTSWRVTKPLRRVLGLRARLAGGAAAADGPVAVALAQPVARQAVAPVHGLAPGAGRRAARVVQGVAPRLAVHQFHSGTAVGDAITNAMLLTRQVLRGLGYHSRIFAEHIDPALQDEIHGKDALPEHDRYVLILRHSMGHDALEQVLGLRAPKILMYHNITPPELLAGSPFMQRYARLGRQQLETIRPAVVAALADSEYNAMELRRLGFDRVAACTLLFDLGEQGAAVAARPERAMAASGLPALFTVLFVGRITASKGQLALVAGFARFRSGYAGATQLVLVGRQDDAAAITELLSLVRRLGLDQGAVDVAGLVSDAVLERRYAEADLYVSASQHEGFGVPLIEAVARGVPVLAVGAGAVPYTLGAPAADPAGLLADTTPTGIAAAILALAMDPAGRASLAESQRASMQRFTLERQIPALVDAVVEAGAARPVDGATRAALAANARFTVAGHVNGTYSLAEINRSLALALEAARPGTVRLLAVEGGITTHVGHVPAEQRGAVGMLLARPAPITGPAIVISQHYPVWVPPVSPELGDVPLALFFWEESLVPAATVAVLNAGFRGVLAPTRMVARALLDSGVSVPVRVVGHVPQLGAFRDIAARRVGRTVEGPFTFLHVSSCFPRKGVDVLLAAWVRAFGAHDAVRLVIKGFPNPHNTVAGDLEALRKVYPGMAEVVLIDDDLPEAALAALYEAADVVVLPTRGEGYNLPAAEAITAGIPLIVTGYGGHMDFVTDVAAAGAAVRLLAYRLAPSRSHLATPFSLWAEPDEGDLVAALREAAGRKRVSTAPAVLPVRDVANEISGFAADLLLAPARGAFTTGWVTTWDVRCGIAEYSRSLLGSVGGDAVIFADERTEIEDAAGLVRPSWRAGDPEMVPSLMAAVLRADPDVLVVQHQPGLIPWATVPGLLNHPALLGRVVCVTMHNTQGLVETPDPVRADVLAALRRMSRVVVHTVGDVNRLAALGLVENTVVIPHGAVRPGKRPAVQPVMRAVSTQDAVVVGCYGFFLPDKGIPELIQALSILRQTWPEARLRLVNAHYPLFLSTDEIARCKGLVAAAGLDQEVEFITEFLEPAASEAALQGCDVIALPYQYSKEGSSAALRSAFGSGVAVAVTPLPLFDEARSAVLELPGVSPAEIAAGLDAALRDGAARERAAAAGRAWLLEREWSMVGERWRGMLDALRSSGVVVGGAGPLKTVWRDR